MPVFHYYKCGACGKKKADINVILCKTCKEQICNKCWYIGNPDPNAKKFAEIIGLSQGAVGKIFDPKCREILWCCPKCNNILLREPADYLSEDELEAIR